MDFFYSAIASVLFINWLFLGFLDINIVKWIYETVLWPIANFFTNGYLMPFMVGMNWSVIAGMLSANVRFRNGHAYQGLLGWIHSWFAGMILFYIMFKYGLLAAMTIHFLYDMMLFVLDAILVGIYHLSYGKPQPKKFQFSDIFRKALLEAEVKRRR